MHGKQLSLALVAVAVLAACGGGDATAPPATTGETGDDPTAPATIQLTVTGEGPFDGELVGICTFLGDAPVVAVDTVRDEATSLTNIEFIAPLAAGAVDVGTSAVDAGTGYGFLYLSISDGESSVGYFAPETLHIETTVDGGRAGTVTASGLVTRLGEPNDIALEASWSC